MTIEFLVDTTKEEEQEKLKKILEAIKKQPKPRVIKEAVFLRKFTLALMGQYRKEAGKNEVMQKTQMPVMQPRIPVMQTHVPVKKTMPSPPRIISLDEISNMEFLGEVYNGGN